MSTWIVSLAGRDAKPTVKLDQPNWPQNGLSNNPIEAVDSESVSCRIPQPLSSRLIFAVETVTIGVAPVYLYILVVISQNSG